MEFKKYYIYTENHILKASVQCLNNGGTEQNVESISELNLFIICLDLLWLDFTGSECYSVSPYL